MTLEFGQVEGGRRAGGHLRLGAMEDVEAEIEQRARHFLAVDSHMPLGQVPAARAHHQHCGIPLERVGLSGRGIDKVDLSRPAVFEIGLALDHVGEHRRGRILEVGHENLRARVQRIDDHLAVDRTGDLDPAVEKVGRNRGDLPVAVTDRFRLGEKVGQLAGVEVFLAPRSPHKQLEPAAVEPPVQPGQKRQRLGAQDFGLPAAGLGVDLDACCGRVRCHEVPPEKRSPSLRKPPRPFRSPWGGRSRRPPGRRRAEIRPPARRVRRTAARARPAA